YKNDAVWNITFKELQEDVEKIIQFKGTLKDSALSIQKMYEYKVNLHSKIEKLLIYSHMKKDEDTKNDIYRSLYDKTENLLTRYNELTSWIIPELMAISNEKINHFINSDELIDYKFDIIRILREKSNTLTENEEKILSLSNLPLSAISDAFSALNNADIVFPRIKNKHGEDKDLTHSQYLSYLHSNDRILRENAWKTYHKKFSEYSTTFSVLLQGEVRNHAFNSKVRSFSSSLEASLFKDNIDVTVYTNLIKTVRENISSLHKYMKYRKQKLKVETLHVYDLYVSFIEYENIQINYNDAKEKILESVKLLGNEYHQVLSNGLNSERWVDIYENENKRSGAYSTGGYLTKPFILLNYNNTLDAARTLAHEAGHSMHSYMTNKYQHPIYSGYPIFLAEVASTFNEELFNDYLLNTTDNKKFKAYILNSMIEDIRGTLFRQTIFAEFELFIHRLIEEGTPLSAELLNTKYIELNKFYYGETLEIDEELGIEWARIPHFYYNFYVYKYATGIAAAISLFKKVKNGTEIEINQYLNFLKAGNSKYPLDILKDAGIDMSTPEPIINAIRHFDFLLEELKKIEGDI
ncbi:MAG TPA: oligoendopeptidase F, partial [Spirochaetia bacterium]|nr:oligoendopeptidase F [Spirochaetia bacterium]